MDKSTFDDVLLEDAKQKGLTVLHDAALATLKKALKGRPLCLQGGGVLFIDEAHMLDPARNTAGYCQRTHGCRGGCQGLADDRHCGLPEGHLTEFVRL
jgi:hypothetical protein